MRLSQRCHKCGTTKISHFVALSQQLPVVLSLHRGEVVDVPPEVVVRGEIGRIELGREGRVKVLKAAEPGTTSFGGVSS